MINAAFARSSTTLHNICSLCQEQMTSDVCSGTFSKAILCHSNTCYFLNHFNSLSQQGYNAVGRATFASAGGEQAGFCSANHSALHSLQLASVKTHLLGQDEPKTSPWPPSPLIRASRCSDDPPPLPSALFVSPAVCLAALPSQAPPCLVRD